MGIDVQLKAVVLMVYGCAASTGLASWDGRERRDPGRLGGSLRCAAGGCVSGPGVQRGLSLGGISGAPAAASTRCSFSTYSVPGTVIGAGNQTIHNRRSPCPRGAYTQCMGF